MTNQYELCMSLVDQHYEASKLLTAMRWQKKVTDFEDTEEAERFQYEINVLADEVDRIGRVASIERYMLLAEANKVDLAEVVVSDRTREAQLALQAKLDAMYDAGED